MIKSQKGKKIQQAKLINQVFQDLQTLLVVGYSGWKVKDFQAMRTLLASQATKLHLFKNSLARREIATKKEWEGLLPSIKGKIFFVHSLESSLTIIKTVHQFLQKFKKTEIKLAFCENKILNKPEIAEIAQLPSQQELYAKMIGILQATSYYLLLTLEKIKERKPKI